MSGPLSNPFMFKSAAGADFYTHQIANSLRLPATSSTAADNSRLTQTFGTVDSNVHFTLNFWIKRSAIEGSNPITSARPLNMFTPRSGTSTSTLHEFLFSAVGSYGAGDAFAITNTNTGAYVLSTNNLFRDTSAWYNIHIQADLDNGTAGEKLKIFVNGTEADYNVDNRSSFSSFAGIAAGAWTLGDYYGPGYPIQSYLAQWAYVDGTTYAPTDFAETKNGVWIPKDLSSGITWGSAGHLLMFQDSGALGDDTSGEGNDWTSVNLAAHDQMLDSPTFNSSSNGGNFCTINPVYSGTAIAGASAKRGTITEGNLKHSYTSSNDASCPCTIKVPPSGKWYFEYAIIAGGGSGDYSPAMGIIDPNVYTNADAGTNTTGLVCYVNYNNKARKNGTFTGTYGGSRGSNGDVMGIAVDMDNGAFYVSKNGTFQAIDGGSTGDPTSGASRTGAGATWTPASEFTSGMIPISQPTGGSAPVIVCNFGQEGTFGGTETAGGNSDTNGYGNFFSSVPSGYSAICTGALAVADAIDPAQTDDNFPSKLFSATLYTGNGSASARNIDTGVAADLVWIKNYGANSSDHMLYDSSRGVGKYIRSNKNVVEDTSGTSLSAFNSDGFQLSDNGTYLNASSNNYVAWNWRAGDGSTSSGSGDLTSTHQVDPSGGFSIVKAVGDGSGSGDKTVTHGMSAAPECIIAKNLNSTFNWDTYWSSGLTSGYGLRLNTNDNQLSGRWGTVNSSIFTCKWNYTWVGSDNFIYYCFRDIEGYIKVGTYTGNANNDGAFVYLGFRPAFLLLREVAADNWGIYDNKRAGQNNDDGDGNAVLYADEAYDEENQASRAIDLLSNGFKLRTSNATFNASGTYVFLAMARNPFKYATAR